MRLGQTGESSQNSPFLQGLPDEFELPSAHAEGRLVTRPGDAENTWLPEMWLSST